MSKNFEIFIKNVLPDWKRVWQLCSGICYAPTEQDVKSVLLDVCKELQDGILQFKKHSLDDNDLAKLLKIKKQEKLLPFTSKLQQLLDLESEQCWEILCFYLTNEYRGTANTLTSLISTESNMIKLLDDIWGYYTLERMITLKIVKNMLEFYENQSHPYHAEYEFILSKITLKNLKKSYLKQFEELINELPPKKVTSGEFLNYNSKLINWNERNCREIIEILHILLLLTKKTGIESSEFISLVNCFKQHSFGRQQRYLNDSNEIHSDLVLKIAYSEIILFMSCLDLNERNFDSNWLTEIINSLNKTLISMYHLPEHGPLLLTWMLINFRLIDDPNEDEESRHYRQFGGKAVQLNVFNYLNDIISHTMFKDNGLVSIVARKTIFNHLSNLCQLFEENGTVGDHNGVYNLLSELLSSSAIAHEFCENEDIPIRSLYTAALENFPVKFINLAEIGLALTIGGKTMFVKEEFEKLPIYTEIYDERNFQLESVGMDEYELINDYQPFLGIEYTIPASTSCVIMESSGKYFVHFRYEVSFYNVLFNEINLLLSEAVQMTDFDYNRLSRVTAGIKYLASAINKIKSPNEITADMVHPTEFCIDLLNKFKVIQTPPIDLLSSCLSVCTALLPHFKKEISTRVLNINILPFVNNDTLDFKKYTNGVSFESGLVGSFLINLERKLEKYNFLLAYLNFLRKYSIANAEEKNEKDKLIKIEIPGLIFILREVLPHIHSWRFLSASERNKIYQECLEYICDVLDILSNGNNSDEKTLLKSICVYSLLNLENGLILLRFIAIGNPFLQSAMENESNWLNAPTISIIRLVRLSMKILMHVLRLKTIIFEATALSPLEALIFAQPKQRDTLRIIPVLTCYMNNIFDRSLPILACRLLRRIALEFKMSLLACLDMEYDQIRLIFLQKLPDELESDDLKISILEFIEACIEKQPGLTEAFFKISYEKEKRLFAPKEKQSQIADSIITYIEIYLNTIRDAPDYVEDPLALCIMSLFHTLWKNNKHVLLSDLIDKYPEFWSSLCAPLFSKDLKLNCKAYGQILNILGIEIFGYNSQMKFNVNLQKTLERFFEQNNFKNWLDHVFNLPREEIKKNDEIPEWLSRLQSFKDFIIILLNKKLKDFQIPENELRTLVKECLKVLVDRSEFTDDFRPFIVISELYLIVLLNFKYKYTADTQEDKDMLFQITKVLFNLASNYESLHPRAKEATLAISIKVTNILESELKKNFLSVQSYLDPIVQIICHELRKLELDVKLELNNVDNINRITEKKSLVLSLNLFKTTANICYSNDEAPTNWDSPFLSNKVFNRLLSCTNLVLQLAVNQNLSIELLDVLIVLAKGNCSNELILCDISEYLWLKLLPPKELLQPPSVIAQNNNNASTKTQITWTAQKWWPIYLRGIELVSILLQKHRHQFLTESLRFVGIHQEYMMDSLLLAKQSLEPNAVSLIKSTVYFVQILVEFEKEWRLDHSQSLFNLMRCVQILLGHSISLFNQQKNLKRLMNGLRTQLDPLKDLAQQCFPDDIVLSLNDLTEIIIISSKCLLKFSPKLLDLICEPEFLTSKWEPLFEIQFGPPKLNDSNQLTFGTVLSIISILTKALNLQGHGFHEIPLNILPAASNQPESIITGNNNVQLGITRTSFNKSISNNSLSSTSAPSNEILSNLDGELCQMALENILTLVASQSLLALKNHNLTQREKQLIRREISSELIIFNEFIRKKVLVDLREHKDIWHRKKRGIVYMNDNDNYINDKTPSATAKRSDNRNSMRINVVRKLHLQHQQEKKIPGKEFEMSQVISPITKQLDHKIIATNPASSTPNIGGSSVRQVDVPDESMNDDDIEEELQFFENEEPKYTPLSFVQFVEEDYLQFLSMLFIIICQSD